MALPAAEFCLLCAQNISNQNEESENFEDGWTDAGMDDCKFKFLLELLGVSYKSVAATFLQNPTVSQWKFIFCEDCNTWITFGIDLKKNLLRVKDKLIAAARRNPERKEDDIYTPNCELGIQHRAYDGIRKFVRQCFSDCEVYLQDPNSNLVQPVHLSERLRSRPNSSSSSSRSRRSSEMQSGPVVVNSSSIPSQRTSSLKNRKINKNERAVASTSSSPDLKSNDIPTDRQTNQIHNNLPEGDGDVESENDPEYYYHNVDIPEDADEFDSPTAAKRSKIAVQNLGQFNQNTSTGFIEEAVGAAITDNEVLVSSEEQGFLNQLDTIGRIQRLQEVMSYQPGFQKCKSCPWGYTSSVVLNLHMVEQHQRMQKGLTFECELCRLKLAETDWHWRAKQRDRCVATLEEGVKIQISSFADLCELHVQRCRVKAGSPQKKIDPKLLRSLAFRNNWQDGKRNKENPKYLCVLCPTRPIKVKELRPHLQENHGLDCENGNHYYCLYCTRPFVSNRVGSFTGEVLPGTRDLEQLKLFAISHLTCKLIKEHQPKIHLCRFCPKTYTSIRFLFNHEHECHRKGKNRIPYVCKYCSAEFSRKDRLTKHMETHSDEIEFADV